MTSKQCVENFTKRLNKANKLHDTNAICFEIQQLCGCSLDKAIDIFIQAFNASAEIRESEYKELKKQNIEGVPHVTTLLRFEINKYQYVIERQEFDTPIRGRRRVYYVIKDQCGYFSVGDFARSQRAIKTRFNSCYKFEASILWKAPNF